ncbi:MAG TPA: hypothetical protein VHE59_18150 [Mucilaginibacter sp.]|nr:hypothetical protein [Mucilaginibacter sp.]
MASRNGLNPKIRGPKGVGYGRALPAAFGFGNGIFPDGSNDYMTIPSLVGKALPDQFTVEIWTKYPDPVNDLAAIIEIETNNNFILIVRSQQPLGLTANFANTSNYSVSLPSDTRKTSIAYGIDLLNNKAYSYFPGSNIFSSSYDFSSSRGIPLNNFKFFQAEAFVTQQSNAGIDEFRLYNGLITNDQFVLNYNNGIGNNPFETENLLVWYKFEKFETLDFSSLQDGSDMRLGIRDLSGHNNHAQPFNMDTDPLSETYVLRPF